MDNFLDILNSLDILLYYHFFFQKIQNTHEIFDGNNQDGNANVHSFSELLPVNKIKY